MQLSPVLAQRIDKVGELTQNCQIVPDLQGAGEEAPMLNDCKRVSWSQEQFTALFMQALITLMDIFVKGAHLSQINMENSKEIIKIFH